MKCLICNHESPNYRGLGNHIRKAHKISVKDYYDKYLKKPGEDICPVCGKFNKFININDGYYRTCSVSCGQKHPDTRKRIETTNINRYGKSTPLITNKSLDKSHNKIAMNKKKNTMLDKYGYISAFSSNETQNKCKETMIQKYGCSNPMVCNFSLFKKYNGTRSSYEQLLKDAFEKNNISYKYEYNKDTRYPYYCDFYLSEKDIFIEINGFWMHNTHWFDKNNKNDRKILKQWKEKSKTSSRMVAAIQVWTKHDVEKRNCAKQNKLNYVVLWTKQDIIDWINSNFQIRHDY